VLAPHVPAREPLAVEVAHFIACANGSGPCRSDGRFGLGVVQILEAAERSWHEGGHPVAVEPLAIPTRFASHAELGLEHAVPFAGA
jgi:hypothetical protein